MSSTSSCTTPVSLRPTSPNLLDQLHNIEDDSFERNSVTSPGSKRYPTFKDYQDKIKQLQQENFQLRVRIYLGEQKAGVTTSSSDLAVLYEQFPKLQGGLSGNNNNQIPLHSNVQQSPPSASSVSNFGELDKIRLEKLQLEEKLRSCEETLGFKEGRITELVQKNESISRNLETANNTIQKLKTTRGKSEEEVEKLACLAFGQGDDFEQMNQEWEAKYLEKSNEVEILTVELNHTQRKLEAAEKKISALKSELRRHEMERPMLEEKINDISESCKELSQRYLQAKHQTERLQQKLAKTTSEKVEQLAHSTAPDKFTAIQNLVNLLQSRVKELADFVETLLQLESKKVFTLTGLTNENRENLLKSIEQARLFSDSLDQLLDKDRLSDNFFSASSFLPQQGNRYGFHTHAQLAGSSRSMFSALDRIRLKSDGVQCNILDSSLFNSLESANAYINKLKHDIHTLEKINIQLGQEKSTLLTQMKTLESNVNVLRMSNHSDGSSSVEHTNSKLKEENRKLIKRLTVTEDALRHLHTQHAKLVAELKLLRSTYQKSSKPSVGNTMVECSRPSDSTSPDLGIDSGHDGAVNSDDSNATNYKEENRVLRTTNRELALKLKQTRQALDITLEKLNSTTKEKEQVEKAICRQLHKTHTILRQAKKSVEKFTNSQCQENIMPTS